jgi:catechol 1,2-dioxygenase
VTDDRVRVVVEDLQRMLTEFIRRHAITPAEYRRATDVIIASVQGGEKSLLFDVFLEAAAVDVGNFGHDGSMEAIEGPFYLPAAPKLSPPHRLPQRPNEAGDVLIFHGTVTNTDGGPLAGVELDIWQADAAGRYSNIFPGIPEWNLRGRLATAADGSFEVQTILPPPYEIPKHGPTGAVLTAIGRHCYRPAHLHVKLRHPGYRELTSQLYFRGGDYLDSDVANAVRDGLILDLACHERPGVADGPTQRYVIARRDFALARHDAIDAHNDEQRQASRQFAD